MNRLHSLFVVGSQIDLYSCSVAAGAGGKSFVNDFAVETGVAIFASDNPVGTVAGSNLILDFRTGQTGTSNELLRIQEMEKIPKLCLALPDDAVCVSKTILDNTPESPGGQFFFQTWTMTNTGTNPWSPNASGYTMNIVGKDELGATPLSINIYPNFYHPYATINSGSSVSPGSTATFTMCFFAPETIGTYWDTFQMAAWTASPSASR